MANFAPKKWTNPSGKNSIFRLSLSLSLENIIKHIFLANIAQKKEDKKMANFGPNQWTNPFGKSQFFDFFNILYL